jgi:predicted DNA-binding transcriptional regulator YafY
MIFKIYPHDIREAIYNPASNGCFLSEIANADKPHERIIEPYFIEPGAWGHSCYVVAYCHCRRAIQTFKAACILGKVSLCADTYEIPPDFNAIDYLNSAWGIDGSQEMYNVKLHFDKRLKETIMANIWHPSQVVEHQSDGSIIMCFKVRNTMDFRAWLLGWGDGVKVLEPEILRDQIIETARSIMHAYTANNPTDKLTRQTSSI